MPLDKPIHEITEADLQALKGGQVPEGRSIEYKRDPVGGNDDAKREFRADVSSFANAAGGDLIFGVDEAGGLPTDVCGLDVDPDAEILRLESMARENIQPRLPYLASHAVPLSNGRHCIVMRVRKSWALHVVVHKSYMQVFSRSSKGKFQLDVPEVKAAFLSSEAVTDRIRQFRHDRLSKVVAGETPVPTSDAPKLVYHLVPLVTFASGVSLEPTLLLERSHELRGRFDFGHAGRYNLDGYVWHTLGEYPRSGDTADKYGLFFRNGCIEALDGFGLSATGPTPKINGLAYDQRAVQPVPGFLSCLGSFGIEPPVILMVSMIGVRGFTLVYDVRSGMLAPPRNPIDRDALLFSEVMVESFDTPAEQIMKPVLDELWNAAGWAGSASYDRDGNWDRQVRRY